MRAGISNPYAGLGQGIGSLGAALIGSAGAKDSARNDRETQLLKNNVLAHQGNKLGIETDKLRYEHQGLQDAAGQVQAYYADQPAYGALAEAALRGGASGDIADLQQGGFRDIARQNIQSDPSLANLAIEYASGRGTPHTVLDGQVFDKTSGVLGAQTLGGAAREGASRASAASSYASARNTGLQAQLRQRELDAGVGSGLPTGYRYTDPADPRAGSELIPGYTPTSGQTINVGGKGQTEFDKALGKRNAEVYANLQDAAVAANNSNTRLDRLDALLESVNTGKFAGTIQTIKGVAKGVGIDLEQFGITDDVAPAQAAAALSNQMALELRNPAGGAGMPGAMSDKDREFLVSMIPGIGTTGPGRALLLESYRKVNERKKEIAQLARDYLRQTGTLDVGFEDAVAQFGDANPIFTDADVAQRDAANVQSSATQGAQSDFVPVGGAGAAGQQRMYTLGDGTQVELQEILDFAEREGIHISDALTQLGAQ